MHDYIPPSGLLNYIENLNLFRDDLDLATRHGYKIYLAIDFYDIVNFCFPYEDSLNIRKPTYWKVAANRNSFYRKQISRAICFLLLEGIYQKPVVLLPSYLDECNEFVVALQRKAEKFVDWGRDGQNEMLENEIFRLMKNAENTKDYRELVNYLNINSPELIYYFSRGFTDGIKIFRHIMRKSLTNDINELFQDAEDNFDLITEPFDKEQADKLRRINEIVQRERKSPPHKDKSVQNKRDAEAIFAVMRLNEIYKKDKKLFILISSAPNISRISRKLNFNKSDERYKVLETSIYGHSFSAVRDTNFFLSALMGIINYLKFNVNKKNLRTLDLNALYLSVKEESEFLSTYYSYDASIGKRYLRIFENYKYEKIFKINQQMNNIDLAFLFNEFLPNTSLGIRVLIDLNEELFNMSQREAAKLIQLTYKDGTFNYELFEKKRELEIIRTENFMNVMREGEKNILIILFNIPLSLKLNDPEAKSIVNRIIELNIGGKQQIRNRGKMSNKLNLLLVNSIKELSIRAEAIEGSERYLIWQFIYIYIGRYDLADNIYNLFYEKASEDIRHEFSYLHAINFIRKMRTIGFDEKDDYEKILSICYKNAFKKEPDANIGDFIKFIKGEQLLELKGGLKAILKTEKSQKNIYIINNTDISLIDIRFVHFGSIILNRFIHDFGSLKEQLMTRQKECFQNIYIPLVKAFVPELEIGILSSYAFFLSLDRFGKNYLENLSQALRLMQNLKIESKKSDDIYWDYVKNYIMGYIHYRLAFHSFKDKQINVECGISYFEQALKELQDSSISLKSLVTSKINMLESIHLKIKG